jgi:hypothetical protein
MKNELLFEAKNTINSVTVRELVLIATDRCRQNELLSTGFAIIPTQISRICGQKANTIASNHFIFIF